MTETEYGVKVTELIDEQAGPDFDYPDSFEADIANCFLRRISPEDAARELVEEYFPED